MLNTIELETQRLRTMVSTIQEHIGAYKASATAPDGPVKPEPITKICSNKTCHRRYTSDGYTQRSDLRIERFIDREQDEKKQALYTFCSMSCLEKWSIALSMAHANVNQTPYQKGIIRG